MSGVRPLPQAKYELLIENKRNGHNLNRILAVSGLTVLFVIVLITVGISWNSLKTFEERRHNIKHVELNSNYSSTVNSMINRVELYGSALKVYLDSNHTHSYVANATNRSLSANINKKTFKLVCYYALPSDDTGGDLIPEEINPSLCTHINIAFARIVNGSLETVSPAVRAIYKRVAALRSGNPALKVLLSVGGGSLPGDFPTMTATHASRKKFIRDVLKLLTDCNLDGLDLDWEFPAWQSEKRERIHFTQLLMELREEFERRHSKFLLSAAVASPQLIVDESYDVSYMAQYVDYVNVMTYDFHFYVWYLPVTGFNSPLFKASSELGFFATLNTNWSVLYWQSKGMPKEKIVIGLPTYGHSFMLINENNNGIAAPASGFGSLGEGGFVSYPEVCRFISEGAATVFDRDSRVPYAYKGKDWVSFDDEKSVGYKAEYILNGGYGGAMFWSLNMDDFKGVCSSTDQKWFPLVTKVKMVLEDDTLSEMEMRLSKALNI